MLASSIGHTFGVRVDEPLARGLWPPNGGRLCSLALRGQRPFGPRVVVAASPQVKRSAAGAAGCVEGLFAPLRGDSPTGLKVVVAAPPQVY